MQKNKPKLLLAGGGYADIPLILSAKSLGYYVITSGNNAADLGHTESDLYCPGDFSDPDAMLEIAQKHNIDAICACCNDFSAISASYVAEKLGLPGHDPYETSLIIHHKDRYRDFALKNNIPTPRAYGCTSIDSAMQALEKLSFPVIIKPVDLTGGKGITRVDDVKDYLSALEGAFSISKTKRIVVEEFVTGTRHGYSAFIKDGKVVFSFTDNEHYHLSPYLVSAASTPSIVPSSAENDLKDQCERICSLLSLKDGLFHVQFILNDNKPYIIEICRRAPGDLYIKFVQYATGVNYPEWIVKSAAGLEIQDFRHEKLSGVLIRHCIMPCSSGFLSNITIDPSLEAKIIDRLEWWKVGDHIKNPDTHKFGIIFAKFDFSTVSDVIFKAENLSAGIQIDLN